MRAARNDEDAVAIHKLLMLMGKEVDLAPVNPIKTMNAVLSMIEAEQGRVVLMAIKDNALVGILAIVQEAPFFSDQMHLQDKAFYVHPHHRNEGVSEALLEEGRCLADATGLVLYISISNTNRRRGSRERAAFQFRYDPIGANLAFKPRT